ncbi:MAG: 50S ribosomal protein L3 [Calditrichia bacterium]
MTAIELCSWALARKKKKYCQASNGCVQKSRVLLWSKLKEFKLLTDTELKAGDQLNVDLFKEGDKVTVVGKSKGRGFAGVMRRHTFSGAQITHGQSDRQRAPGSLGQKLLPSKVFKGIRMGGRMGNVKVAGLKNCESGCGKQFVVHFRCRTRIP